MTTFTKTDIEEFQDACWQILEKEQTNNIFGMMLPGGNGLCWEIKNIVGNGNSYDIIDKLDTGNSTKNSWMFHTERYGVFTPMRITALIFMVTWTVDEIMEMLE